MLMFGLAMSILQPQHVRAVGELARAHPPQQIEILGDAAVAIRARRAGLGQRAARRAHLVGRLAVDVREALARRTTRRIRRGRRSSPTRDSDACPSRSRASAPTSAIESSNSTSSFSGLVSSKRRWQRAAVFRGEAEIQDDRLRVTVMQVAVGLGRKARDDAPAVLVAFALSSAMIARRKLEPGPASRRGVGPPRSERVDRRPFAARCTGRILRQCSMHRFCS